MFHLRPPSQDNRTRVQFRQVLCALTAAGIFLSSCGISEADVQATIAALPTQTTIPSETPTTSPTPPPTATETPNAQGYLADKLESLDRLRANIDRFSDLIGEASDDITVMFDEVWRTGMGNVLAQLRFRANELRETDSPPMYADFQLLMNLTADELDRLVANMILVMDDFDSDALGRAINNLTNIEAYALQGLALLTQLD